MMQPKNKPPETAAFTENELHYLANRSLARIAFVCQDRVARIMPVLFEFDGHNFYLSGWNLKYSQRFQTLPEKAHITLLIDDIAQPREITLRGIEVTGLAETREDGGYYYVLIKPVNKTSWGI